MNLNSTSFSSESSLSSKKISIFLVDDHELVRAGVARMLCDEEDMSVIGEASSGEEAVEFIKHNTPDIVLMDARMPGIGGIEATHRLVKICPKIKIIAMSSVASGVIPSQMLRAGAMSFITKNVGVEEMLKAVRMGSEDQRRSALCNTRSCNPAGIGPVQ